MLDNKPHYRGYVLTTILITSALKYSVNVMQANKLILTKEAVPDILSEPAVQDNRPAGTAADTADRGILFQGEGDSYI